MGNFRFHQYQVVGRALPTATDEHPKIYRMKLWATNEVRAKSKFWYFLRKLKKVKKSNGQVLAINEIFERKPTKIKNYGIWLRYQSRTGYHNMYKEYRDTTLNGSVEQMYNEMASRHRVRCHCIQIIKTATIPSKLSMEANVVSSSSSTFANRSLLLAVCGARINISQKDANPHHHRHSFPVRKPPGCPRVLWKLKAHSVNVGNLAVPLQWALTEENLLFLEAWRTVDRAYVDKSFNGQSWFRYRENALRNEPMNTREETYRAIKKMLSTLDDPFTRFLEPEKFKSLRSGTQGALTGVGLSIGYPLVLNGSPTGLVVVSSAPGGPADKAGIASGDIILAIDDESTEDMDIYDAAERLQGTEGSSVKLVIHSGPEIKDVVLRREKVTFNPVKTRLCEITRSGAEKSRVGYIKLTSFNQNASGAVKDAIETLRSNGVKAFVLDLRNNSGGLFPEGIEIAKIWLDKGVIVYICDNRGVRDIYEADGSSTVAASEPLTVLVNKGTASASEILAGALKDNRRAVLYGEPTFGKGKIQSVFELSDGSGLAVTVARYETPAHTNIDKVGIKPDHPLPTPFPTDEEEFCSCLKDPSSPCNLSSSQLFSR
ncbi:TSPc [Musa troglodytarum]|uniref:C-terminal processing peptidase n=1 Tax=Musa troglodytarum TaxID=320322 RepID=A0A9E7GXT7_9LILI|nr:TSPc [Musa troglodytarum]URE20082.1 TSPc [Musa troglodytarum]